MRGTGQTLATNHGQAQKRFGPHGANILMIVAPAPGKAETPPGQDGSLAELLAGMVRSALAWEEDNAGDAGNISKQDPCVGDPDSTCK